MKMCVYRSRREEREMFTCRDQKEDGNHLLDDSSTCVDINTAPLVIYTTAPH